MLTGDLFIQATNPGDSIELFNSAATDIDFSSAAFSN